MSLIERRAALSLASILALRMLGLFMILPVFSLYAHDLKNATPTLIGIALGIYGLTQGLFQIPIGMLSDVFGRKKLIAVGLAIFVSGSIIAALAHSIYAMILGRALQGVGAVGSAILALLADLTRAEQRAKAMALCGITIGLSFALAMVLGPILNTWINLFWLAAFLGLCALLVLFYFVPTPTHTSWHSDTEPELGYFKTLLKQPEMMRLNAGIFFLHTILTATFVVLPISLQQLSGILLHQQWLVYFPTLILSFILSIYMIMRAEKKAQLKLYFMGGIFMLMSAELFFWVFARNNLLSAVSLLLFFTAFSLLEAFLPSLVTRAAPPKRKGTALGIYSSSQFLGIFMGGLIGGWLYGKLGLTSVYLFCVIITIFWVCVAFGMKNPQHSTTN